MDVGLVVLLYTQSQLLEVMQLTVPGSPVHMTDILGAAAAKSRN